MTIAPFIANAPNGLFGYLQEVNGCYSIPILTIILVGYITKYVPAVAAKIAIISGVALYSISQFLLKPFVFGEANYPHYLHVMAVLFVINIIVMLLIGYFKPMKQPYIQKYSHDVDIKPWKFLYVTGGMIVLIVLSIYLYFS
jgi:SSS family solute:Na+ symporter